ncbi:MAG TPA: peptidylprolyl isomerase [Anaerohalosphaeraceae bacterium]|nr:peptidylprolyl isomerase [Phycisphaerae bacterium]HOK94870.1 peptidylprolyl isomerase [Anaerohalosphaeraceae bacterium]HOL30978.1 peptidylprolyl isomerase [Anaerohalosphaeraceae bacterium]HOM76240.1 peptidylprolyl isomerase [Anaerohalosphaeraceae bacterium]HPC63377.1 peptidylprolyl isomerase [Anaerohalosphaeraceae bacterium]
MKTYFLIAAVGLTAGWISAYGADSKTPMPAAPAAQNPAVQKEAVVVTVNGEKVTEKEIADELAKRIEGQKKRMPAGMELPESYRQQMRKRVVDMKVEQILMNQEAKKKNIAIPDAEVVAEITKIAGRQGQSMEDVEKEIANWGMTMEDLKGQIRYQMQIKALMKAENKNPEPSDEEVRKFYDDNPQHFDQPEQVRASHILIKVDSDAAAEEKAKAKEKIEGILKRAKAGEDFAALAKEFSEDPGSKDTGGEYTFPRGQMVKPFEDAAFALEPNQISDIVETQFGYHIIKLSEKIAAGKTPFETVKNQIADYLANQKQNEYWNEYNKKIHESATIEFSPEEKALRDQIEKEAAQRMLQQLQQQAQQQAQPQNKPEQKAEK